MSKEQWQELYRILYSINTRFRKNYYEHQHGRTKKIRDSAGNEVDVTIRFAVSHIEKYSTAYELLTGGSNTDTHTCAIFYDEFKQPRYFEHEMPAFLNKIKEKIQSLDSEIELSQ